MKPSETIVEYYLREFRAGRCDDAFHSLIEASPEVISELIDAYMSTDDVDTKVFAIEVIAEFRLSTSLYFLRYALRREDPRIWRSALDGLCMVESAEAVDAMEHVLVSVSDSGKRAWIEEAISDTNTALKTKEKQDGGDNSASPSASD